MFISFTAASGASKSVDALFITRFFGGLFAAAPVVNVGGALADLFEPKSRATAVVAYSVAVVAGPTLRAALPSCFKLKADVSQRSSHRL